MNNYDRQSSADRETNEPGIHTMDQRNEGKPRRWEQKLVQIKTMEGEFSVTMWASGTSDDEFSNSDNNADELDYLPENGADNTNAETTTFRADVQAISDNNQLQLQKSETAVLQQQQQLFFHQQQEQFLQQLTLSLPPPAQQKSSTNFQLPLEDNPALNQNDNDCEPTTTEAAAAIGNLSFSLGKQNTLGNIGLSGKKAVIIWSYTPVWLIVVYLCSLQSHAQLLYMTIRFD